MAAMASGVAATHRRHAHHALFKKASNETASVCTPACTTHWVTVTGPPGLVPNPAQETGVNAEPTDQSTRVVHEVKTGHVTVCPLSSTGLPTGGSSTNPAAAATGPATQTTPVSTPDAAAATGPATSVNAEPTVESTRIVHAVKTGHVTVCPFSTGLPTASASTNPAAAATGADTQTTPASTTTASAAAPPPPANSQTPSAAAPAPVNSETPLAAAPAPLNSETPSAAAPAPPVISQTPLAAAPAPPVDSETPSAAAPAPPVNSQTPLAAAPAPPVNSETPSAAAPAPPVNSETPSAAAPAPPVISQTPSAAAPAPPVNSETPSAAAPAPPVNSETPSAAAPAPPVNSQTPSAAAPAPPKKSGAATITHALTSDNDHFGMTYTPYDSVTGQCKSAAAVDADIALIKNAGFSTIRVYSTDCNMTKTVAPACRKYGLAMIVGVFVKASGCDVNTPEVKEQVDALVAWNDWDLVSLVVVGNEAIMNGYCSPAQLKELVVAVKSSCSAKYTGRYTISETLNIWLRPDVTATLCPVIDVTGANIHAYFNSGVAPAMAGVFVKGQLDILATMCPGNEVINLECGYPSGGNANGLAIPGVSQQSVAIEAIRKLAGHKTVFFSPHNDLWKGASACDCEDKFGLASVFGF
ncbi:hypothetical protein E4U41_005724 [Claviceps citrina]|nr:hypothetical protein E4U41_005724 [Claviceps citrina]